MLPNESLSMKTKDHSCNVTQVGIVKDPKAIVAQMYDVNDQDVAVTQQKRVKDH